MEMSNLTERSSSDSSFKNNISSESPIPDHCKVFQEKLMKLSKPPTHCIGGCLLSDMLTFTQIQSFQFVVRVFIIFQ